MPVGERNQVEDIRSTKLKGWGTSQGVRIPRHICAWTGIEQDSELSMETGSDEEGRYILLRPMSTDGHRHYGAAVRAASLDELFKGYSEGYDPTSSTGVPTSGRGLLDELPRARRHH